MATPIFDLDRSLNALLYVTNKLTKRDIHKIFKILYFADMAHLFKYGRAITGDRYIAMKYGPVPSGIYDLVKIVRGDSNIYSYFAKKTHQINEIKAFFKVSNKFLNPLRPADMNYLSATDVAELDNAIEQYKDVNFDNMTLLSHGSAWDKTWNSPNDEIPIEDILSEAGAPQEYIDYITENLMAQKELAK